MLLFILLNYKNIMKKLTYVFLFIFVIYGTQSCNNPRSTDPVKMAKKANEAKDTTDYIDTRGIGTEEFPAVAIQSYSDADFAVDVTDRSLLEIQLGKVSLTHSS